jgi:hypothetical protein
MSSTRKPFPSIVISPNKIGANGTFAETQVSYLTPDEDTIKELDSALRKANMGVVSHFYMVKYKTMSQTNLMMLTAFS